MEPLREPSVTTCRKKVICPKAGHRKQWQAFEEVDKVLETALAGDMGRKLKAISIITYSMGLERFRVVEAKAGKPATSDGNRREREITKI